VRVGIIAYDFFPFEGGQGRHIYELFTRLREMPGIEPFVFSSAQNNLESHIQIFPITKKYGKNISFSLLLTSILDSLIKRHNLDILHFHGGPGGVLLFKTPSVPIVYTAHHTYYQQCGLIPNQEWKKIFIGFERNGYRLSEKIIAVSNDTKGVLTEKYQVDARKVKVIPNGVDVGRFHPTRDVVKRKNSLLFVGRLDRRKGIDYLVEAILYVKKEIPDAVLFIVGEGKLKHKLVEFIKSNNLTSNIIFLGSISDDELVEWYSKVQALVVPSLFEGFGIVCIEAMACGLPVIGTKVPGIVDIIRDRDNGLLVPPQDSKGLAEAIVQMLNDNYLRKLLRNKGRDEVLKRFSWESIANKTAQIYREVMNES